MLVYLYLVAGLILLLEGADWLLEGAASLAKKFKVHKLVIGLTIIAFGTSLPELFVSIIASSMKNSDIIMGNILGSNIANILLILGITAAITRVPLHRDTVWKEIPFSFLGMLIMLILLNKAMMGLGQNSINMIDGLVMLIFFIIFILHTSGIILKPELEKEEIREEIELAEPKFKNIFMILGAIILGIIALYVGGKMTVDNAITISKSLGISEFFISATIVAIGTSLPELVVSIKAAIKKELDLAIGNVIGSNIFNVLFILSIASFINPVAATSYVIIDIIIALAATALLFLFMFIGEKHTLNRWQGILFVLIYIAYILYALLR